MDSQASPNVFRFILNTTDIVFSSSRLEERKSTQKWLEQPSVAALLALLPTSERDRVARYHFSRDAALSLGAFLLKHLAVVRGTGVKWVDSVITVDPEVNKGKPYYKDGGVTFNVSHHGTQVALVGTTVPDLKVGIDVVEVNLVKDKKSIEKQGGWAQWVNVFADVFSENELEYMVTFEPAQLQTADEDARLSERLRLFYAHWALKEAYIKMDGEALFATWLKSVEFRKVIVPKAAEPSIDRHWRMDWGATSHDIEVWLHGKQLPNLKVELQALGQDYMVATVIFPYGKKDVLPHFETIGVYPHISAATQV